MTEFSSVRTSRVGSVNTRFSYRTATSTQLSRLTRISDLQRSSLKSSVISRPGMNDEVLDWLEERVVMDEYGVTDKVCRNCSNKLSLEELIALTIPLDKEGNPLVELKDINLDEIPLICLDCYANVVSKKSTWRQSTQSPRNTKNLGATTITDKKSARHSSMEFSRAPSQKSSGEAPVVPFQKYRQQSETKVKPQSPSAISNISSASYHSRRLTTANSRRSNKEALSQVSIASGPKFRKRSDISIYANAAFRGGVFLNTIPGQSI